MNYIILLVILLISFCLDGCSVLPDTTSTRTITQYDKKGKIVSQTQISAPAPDTQIGFQETQRIVAQAASETDQKRVKGITDITKSTMATAKTPTEAVLVAVIGSLSIQRMKSSIPEALAALGERPMNGWEGGIGLLHEITGMAWTIPVTVGLRQNGKTGRAGIEGAGVDISTVGDGNTTSTKSVKTISTIHNNTTGDNSPATTTLDQNATDSCPSGDCNKDDEIDAPICDEAFVATIPGCSGCESYLAGRCSVKP